MVITLEFCDRLGACIATFRHLKVFLGEFWNGWCESFFVFVRSFNDSLAWLDQCVIFRVVNISDLHSWSILGTCSTSGALRGRIKVDSKLLCQHFHFHSSTFVFFLLLVLLRKTKLFISFLLHALSLLTSELSAETSSSEDVLDPLVPGLVLDLGG